MSAGGSMGFSVPLTADVLAALGQIKAASKDIRNELREIEKAEKKAVKKGKTLTTEQIERRESLQKKQADIVRFEKGKKDAAVAAKKSAAQVSGIWHGIARTGSILSSGVNIGDVAQIGSVLGGAAKAGWKKYATSAIGVAAATKISMNAAAAMSGVKAIGSAAAPVALGIGAGLAVKAGRDWAANRDKAAVGSDRDLFTRMNKMFGDTQHGTKFSASFQKNFMNEVRSETNKAADVAINASFSERTYKALGYSPSEAISADKLKAQNLEMQRQMLGRRFGSQFLESTKTENIIKNDDKVRRQVQRAKWEYGVFGRMWFGVKDVFVDATEELEYKYASGRKKELMEAPLKKIESEDPRKPNHPRYLKYKSTAMLNAIMLQSQLADSIKRTLQWNPIG